MLHGTWFIGWTSQADEDFSELKVSKFKPTAKGFESAPTPKNIDEIKLLIERCHQVGSNVMALYMGLAVPDMGLKSTFTKVNKKWKANQNIAY
jgi:hypothetical protein